MGTAKSGYIQRRIVKCCEDIQVQYDGTVRDTTGNIYQMAYGDNGFDPCNTVKVGNTQEPCDIARMVALLNLQHEIKSEEKIVSESKTEKKESKSEKKLVTESKSEKKECKTDVSRVFLLKELAKKTGVKRLYKGWSIEDLTKHLEEMNLKDKK